MDPEGGLSSLEHLRLSVSSLHYSVVRALRLNKLRDLLQGAHLSMDAPVWLLGERYSAAEGSGPEEEEEVREALPRLWGSSGAPRLRGPIRLGRP